VSRTAGGDDQSGDGRGKTALRPVRPVESVARWANCWPPKDSLSCWLHVAKTVSNDSPTNCNRAGASRVIRCAAIWPTRRLRPLSSHCCSPDAVEQLTRQPLLSQTAVIGNRSPELCLADVHVGVPSLFPKLDLMRSALSPIRQSLTSAEPHPISLLGCSSQHQKCASVFSCAACGRATTPC
jgi:hypothetical protein